MTHQLLRFQRPLICDAFHSQNGRLEKSFEVMQIPYTRSEPIGNIYNISMDFPSSDTCVLTDGAGSLYIIETSNRSSGDIVPWKVSMFYFCLRFPYVSIETFILLTDQDFILKALLRAMSDHQK